MSNDKNKNADTEDLKRAKIGAELAKKRFSATSSTLQERLKPGNLASEAWSGARGRGEDLADNALQTVKDRPVAASGIAAAIVVFLAREPLWKAVSWLFRGSNDKDLVTTKVSHKDDNYDLAAPAVSRSVDEGAIA